jgi:hypothetical protein
MYLVIIHPDNKNYRQLRLNHLDDEVVSMLECRKRALDMKVNKTIVLPLPECELLDE